MTGSGRPGSRRQRWRCDKCGARGAVDHERDAGVYEVLGWLRDDHAARSPGCRLDLARVQVDPPKDL